MTDILLTIDIYETQFRTEKSFENRNDQGSRLLEWIVVCFSYFSLIFSAYVELGSKGHNHCQTQGSRI